MVEREKPSEGAWVRLEVPDPSTFPDPTGANFFSFAWNGPEVQLLVGYLDLIPPTVSKDKEAVLKPMISHRIFMSVRGFALLRAQLNKAAELLMAAGVRLDELNPLEKP